MVYVVNVCGYGSFGADCYVEALRNGLRETWPSSKVTVNRLDNVPFSPDTHEAVVLGGGGLLYHYIHGCGSDNLKHFLRYPAAMQAFGKPSFALGVGVQGAFESSHLAPYVDVLNGMNLRTVRDARSAEILREAGVSAPIIESADLSYLMKIPERRQRDPRKRPALGIAVSQPLKGIIYEESVGFEARVFDAVADLSLDFDIHFYSFDRRNEGAIADEWVKPHSRSFYDPAATDAIDKFTEAIGESDLFLTSRLHGVILCSRMGVPFVSIGAPGEKIERESGALEHPFHLPYSADSDEIVRQLRDVWDARSEIANDLKRTSACREVLAQKTMVALHACN